MPERRQDWRSGPDGAQTPLSRITAGIENRVHCSN
jgi:hypothetical protein